MRVFFLIFFLGFVVNCFGQIDPELLRAPGKDSEQLKLNLDAVYDRPFIQPFKIPVAVGGYMEANYQYVGENGVSEGHQFQMRRVTLFISSSISQRMKFLTEIEFEDGTKEINIEFASLDFEFAPLLNFRGGIIMNPIGAFNQNHDGPKWEFVDRPVSATQLLPATFSNAGFGLYGKRSAGDWAYAYEAYLTNGFNERLIDNIDNRTSLPAVKLDPERFEESFNGSMLFTGKLAVKNRKYGELGLSYMSGAYNKFQDDGLVLDKKRAATVYAIDYNTSLDNDAAIKAEWNWVAVDLPRAFTDQFGRKQQGGYIDFVQPIYKKPVLGFENSVFNAAVRFEYVDFNRDHFRTTGKKIGDEFLSIVPAISWRPSSQTVFRLNYRYNWKRDLLNNPFAKSAAVQIGISTYF